MLAMDAVRSEYADDPDMQELLEMYLAEIPDRLKHLQQLFADGNFAELSRMAHQMKGSAGGYGFPGLSEVARHLEVACKKEEGPIRIGDCLHQTLEYGQRMTA